MKTQVILGRLNSNLPKLYSEQTEEKTKQNTRVTFIHYFKGRLINFQYRYKA